MTNPDSDRQLDALFAQARGQRPDTSALDFAFETRLLAHLRNAQAAPLAWACVSWRLIPFLVAAVAALTFWHSQVVAEANDAEQIAYVAHSGSLDSWGSFN